MKRLFILLFFVLMVATGCETYVVVKTPHYRSYQYEYRTRHYVRYQFWHHAPYYLKSHRHFQKNTIHDSSLKNKRDRGDARKNTVERRNRR